MTELKSALRLSRFTCLHDAAIIKPEKKMKRRLFRSVVSPYCAQGLSNQILIPPSWPLQPCQACRDLPTAPPLYCDVCGIPDVEHPKSSTHATTQEPYSRKRSPKFSTHDSIQFSSTQVSDPTGNMSTEVPESRAGTSSGPLHAKRPNLLLNHIPTAAPKPTWFIRTDLTIPS